MQNEKEKMSTGDKVNDFIQKNRTGIFVTMGILVIGFIGVIAYFAVSDHVNKKAIAAIEELNQRFLDLYEQIEVGETSDEIEGLIAELKEFGHNNGGFSGSKAFSLAAQAYMFREEWALAEEAWLESARIGAKTYLGPIALYQAAAVSEEQEKYEEAIDLYRQCISHKFDFPAAPRAQLAIGRLYEKIEDFPAAAEAYREVLIKWPDIDVLQNLARSRIIAIEVR